MAVSVNTDAWGRPSTPPTSSSMASMLKPTKSFKDYVRENKDTVQQASVMFSVIFIIYMFFSDGDFSFLLTLSSIFSCASFLKVFWVIFTKKSVAGVSCQMMECYVFAFFSRLVSILAMDGYLPFDRSGDYIYRFSEIGCFIVSCGIVWFCRSKFAATYDNSGDSLKSYYLAGPCVILGLLFHPHLNGFMLCDVAWSQGLYLEAVACLPQLVLFRKQKKVESFTTSFLMTQILVRVFSFLFWASSSRDLHSYHLEGTIREYASSMVVIMQVLQLLVMCDFVWQYLKCWKNNIPLSYAITHDLV